jgi:cell division protein FtsL
VKGQSFTLTKAVANEQLVRELDRKRHRELFWVAFLGVVLTLSVIVYAWPHFELIRLGYRMEELRERRDELVQLKHHLELQRATESDPARIESIAKNELGMVYPGPEQILVIEPVESPRPTGTDKASANGIRRVSR